MADQTSPLSHDVLTQLTAEVVSAFVARNAIPSGELPTLLSSVYGALNHIANPIPAPVAEPKQPAVPIKRSITDDYIISLEDGRKLRSMKRYLTGLGMTPADYRAKWGLPSDYPMVAPSYAAARSSLAKTMGLGRKAAGALAAPVPAAQDPATPAKRGRAKKAA